jgi:dTDP-4-dehydrorhamnose reductase
MQVLVIGASGLVGRNIVDYCRMRDIQVIGTARNDADVVDKIHDISSLNETQNIINATKPDIVINASAFHDVDACEVERERAFNVNVIGTRNAAVAAADVGAHYVFFSSDYVFSGDPSETPYAEDDPVAPVNYYGKTKYAGEQAAKIPTSSTILRPSVIYGLASPNFVTWVLGELSEGREVKIVDDQISTPTYAADLAKATIEAATDDLTGVYHAAGPDSVSRYEFTLCLANVFGYDETLVQPISTEEFGQEAPRPVDGTLDSTRLYDAINHDFRSLREALKDMKERN